MSGSCSGSEEGRERFCEVFDVVVEGVSGDALEEMGVIADGVCSKWD